VSGNHRYWLLRVEQNNGGIGSGVPQLQAGWQPHQLLFVTRGNAPFQIAYGNSEIKPAEFRMQNVLPKTGQDQSELKIQPAQTGAQITLGGTARLSPRQNCCRGKNGYCGRYWAWLLCYWDGWLTGWCSRWRATIKAKATN